MSQGDVFSNAFNQNIGTNHSGLIRLTHRMTGKMSRAADSPEQSGVVLVLHVRAAQNCKSARTAVVQFFIGFAVTV